MAAWSASRVLSGSFAEIWVDGSRIAEASGIQMTIKMQRSDVQIGMDVDSKITGWRQDGQRNAMERFASSIITVTSGGVSPTVFCRFVCRLVWVVRLIWVVLLYYTTISAPCQRGNILPPEGRWSILAQRGDPP